MPALSCASFLILIISLLIPEIAYSQETSVLIVGSSNKTFSNRLIESLNIELKQKNITTKIKIIDQNNNLSKTEAQQHKLIIALGSVASKHIFEQNIDTPILSLLIPTQSLERLKSLKKNQSPWAVVFLDQPLQRQIIFSRYLLGTGKIIGFLLGPYSGKQLASITDTARNLNIDIAVEHIDNDDLLIPSIKNLINNSDTILSLPDPVAFNRKTIRGILLISYRNNMPVIGFSKSYVKSGALAAVYSTTEQISLHASEITADFIDKKEFKQTLNYPIYYSIATNLQVARTLGINIKSDSELLELIKNFEQTK
ncbi:MAG: ABC transporter substrate-binding protein [Gammaproteobacteria bacterium]